MILNIKYYFFDRNHIYIYIQTFITLSQADDFEIKRISYFIKFSQILFYGIKTSGSRLEALDATVMFIAVIILTKTF